MCVWFNNYGLLKIPLFFSKKIKYSKNKKNPEVGHTKLPKFLYFHPHPPPSYTSGRSTGSSFQILAKIPGNQL